MPLHEPATSAIGSPHVYAGETTMPSGACKRDDRSFRVPAKEKLDDRKVFSLNLTYVVAFHRLNRHFGPTSGCPQFAFLRWSQFQECTLYI